MRGLKQVIQQGENGNRGSLGALGFFATTLVVVHHIRALISWQPQGLVDLGMTFLFVLAGFVIPLRYQRLGGIRDAGIFLWRHLTGMVPLHLAAFFMSIPLCLAFNVKAGFAVAVQNILLLHSWSGTRETVFSFNSVSWFLSTLAFGYLAAAVLLLRPRILFPVAFLGSMLSVVLSARYIQQVHPPDTNLIVWLMYIFPLNRLFNILCGMGAGYMFLKLPRPGGGRGTRLMWTGLEVIAVGFFLERIVFKYITNAAFSQMSPLFPWVSHTAKQLFENYLMCPALGILLIFIVGYRAGYLSMLFEKRLFAFLGKISLSLYLSHQLVFLFLSLVREPFVFEFGEKGFACFGVFLAVLVATILHAVVEKPGQKILTSPRSELPRLRAMVRCWFRYVTRDVFENKRSIERINSLSALRFLGMLVVMLHHIDFLLGRQAVTGLNFILTYFFTFSGFAVYLGFRRFYSLREMVIFIWNRVIRIYPVYFVTFLIGGWLVYLEGSPIRVSSGLANLMLVQSWFRASDIFFSFNAVGWFVSTLMFLYIVFAAIMSKPSYYFYGALFLAFVSVGATAAHLESQPAPAPNVLYGWFYVFPPNRLLVFLSGVASAIVFVECYERLRGGLSVFAATVLEVIALSLVVERVFFRNIIDFVASEILTYAIHLPHTGYFLLDDYVSSVLLTNVLLFVFALEKGLISRIFSVRIFVLLGATSFTIFLSHQLVFRFFSLYGESLFQAYGVLPTTVAAFLLCIPVAYLIYRVVEIPGARWLRRTYLAEVLLSSSDRVPRRIPDNMNEASRELD